MKIKAKRIKRVFSSSQEVFHLWAAQMQNDARQGGNRSRAFFVDNSCYSYGMHYEVGRLVMIKGVQVALINRVGYSHTTGKHINEASSAVSHLPSITVDHSFDWKKGMLNMQADLVNSLFNTLKQRSFWDPHKVYDKYVQEEYTKFNKLCVTVGMKHLQLFPSKETIVLLQGYVDHRIKREKELKEFRLTPQGIAKIEADKLKREEAQARKYAGELDAWKQGGSFTAQVSRCSPQLIRIQGEYVQTSSRASVPLVEAKLAYTALMKGKLKTGDAIGSYKFSSVDKDAQTVKIGCHTIRLSDAQALLGDKE